MEIEKNGHSYDSLQIDLPYKMAEDIIIYAYSLPQEFLTKDGIEYNQHITIKYGFNDVEPDEIAEIIDEYGPVRFELGEIDAFHQPDQDVLIIKIDSPDLVELNQMLVDAFSDRITTTYPDYIPHCTIAYMKKNMASTYKFNDGFLGRIGEVDKTVYSYDGESYEISLVGKFDDVMTEEAIEVDDLPTEIQKRCPKHDWVPLGTTRPYDHQGHGKHIGIKTKEMCVTCGQERWRNMRTGNKANQRTYES